MSARRATITSSVTAPFEHLVLRLVRLDCGSRGWSLRAADFGPDAPPLVNGSLDGAEIDALIADFETATSCLRQFRDMTNQEVQE